MTEVKAWHFTDRTLRDGRPIPSKGEWLVHDGPIVPCESGLHGSERLLGALTYAPGPLLHRVTLRGDVTPHGNPVDKLVARERRIDWTLDEEATERVLREFARWCALQVIHLWDAPDAVREYLETGDERLRDAAWDAARAAWAAARAAWDAAWAAARAAGDAAGAAGDAAGATRDAAWATAWAAARAARDARDAARAARDAARATRDAARATAGAAAWVAAGAAAWDSQNAELTRRILEAAGRTE